MRWLDWFTHVCACWKHTIPSVRLKLHTLARAQCSEGRDLSVFLHLCFAVASPIFSLRLTTPSSHSLLFACSFTFSLSLSLSLLHPSSILTFFVPLDACLNLFLPARDAMVHAEIERIEYTYSGRVAARRGEWCCLRC